MKALFPSALHGLMRYTLSFSTPPFMNAQSLKTNPISCLCPLGAATYPGSFDMIFTSLNSASAPPKMKSTPPVPDTPYVIWLIPGLVPWFYFQEALLGVTNNLQEYNYLVKKVVFPVELLPIIKVLSSLFVHFCFLLIMAVVFLVAGYTPKISWIQVFYYTAGATVLALGLGYITSSVNVFFKDMSQIVGICLQFGMWLAPIMYWDGMFTQEHPWMAPIFKLNPFYYIVAGYRDSMLTGNAFWERPLNTLYFWIVTTGIFYIGLKIFNKLRPHFSDVL